MNPDLLLAFMTGLLGGFGHCIGMCGPVVAAYTLSGQSGPSDQLGRAGQSDRAGPAGRAFKPHLLYNAGRITTYGIIGLMMGLGGMAVSSLPGLPLARSMVYMVAGFVMVYMGVSVAAGSNLLSCAEDRGGFILKAGKVVLETGSGFRYFPLGLLFGFLPCGLSYSIFIGSAAAGGALEGGAFALSFALGTVPALLMFGMVVSYIGAKVRGIIYRTGGILVLAMGLRFIYKGIMFYAGM